MGFLSSESFVIDSPLSVGEVLQVLNDNTRPRDRSSGPIDFGKLFFGDKRYFHGTITETSFRIQMFDTTTDIDRCVTVIRGSIIATKTGTQIETNIRPYYNLLVFEVIYVLAILCFFVLGLINPDKEFFIVSLAMTIVFPLQMLVTDYNYKRQKRAMKKILYDIFTAEQQ